MAQPEKFSLTLKDIESFFLHSIMDRLEKYWNHKEYLLMKMSTMGYTDEPDFDKKGKPILRRTTPIHLMARGDLRIPNIDYTIMARRLFHVYNKFYLNYIDEFGLTHFHVACRYGYKDVVQKFLDFGQDPNLLVREIEDSPLLLALNWRHKEVAELLLRRGADSNLPNKNGLTPLHVICQTTDDGDLAKFFFNINDTLNKLVRINVRDKFGNTPLHFAVHFDKKEMVKLLLRRGADLNLVNAEGSIPLHIVCHRWNNYDLSKLFFEINKELDRPVQVNVADNHGRTPLHLAVFYLRPDIVDVLINNGADLSDFVFPADIYFGEKVEPPRHEIRANFELRLASSAWLVVELLVRSGYKMYRSNALTIMKLFAKRGLFEKSADLEKRLSDDEEFAAKAKEIMVKPGLSLYDLIRLPTEEASKLVTLKEYFDFSRSSKLHIKHQEACLVHLCEKLSRKFFEYWTLYPFWKLIHYRLSILCCDMIIENLNNEDLYNICLAGEEQSLEDTMKDSTAIVIKCNKNKRPRADES